LGREFDVIVKQVMSSELRTLKRESSVRLAMKLLVLGDIRHLPVLDDGRLVGIVSERDLQPLFAGVLEKVERPDDVERRLSQPISNVMTTHVLAVNPETELVDAVEIMVANRIGALPVVETETAKVVGIVSYVDVLKAVRSLLAAKSS
jgi:acetoin utilization protein AcuB